MRPRRPATFLTAARAVCLEMPQEMRVIRMDKEIRDLMKVAVSTGWDVKPLSGNKLRWIPPQKDVDAVVTADRVGNGSTWKNALGNLAKAGLDVSSVKGYTPPKANIAEAGDPEIAAALPISDSALEEARKEWSPEIADFDLMFHDYIKMVMAAGFSLARQATIFADKHDDEVIALMEKYEKQVEDANAERDALQRSCDKYATDLSRLGGELQTVRQQLVEQTERANKAENKLRMFRSALQED